jgi:hypothetical protein
MTWRTRLALAYGVLLGLYTWASMVAGACRDFGHEGDCGVLSSPGILHTVATPPAGLVFLLASFVLAFAIGRAWVLLLAFVPAIPAVVLQLTGFQTYDVQPLFYAFTVPPWYLAPLFIGFVVGKVWRGTSGSARPTPTA